MQTLNQLLDAALMFNGADFFKSKVPDAVYRNLKPRFGRRPYQAEAFGRFVYYLNEYPGRPQQQPLQLLFHMATGSGKTLVMAGLILYLYEKGYRNFLFFVNSANIIDKTRENFLNPASAKYLFSDTLTIGGQQVRLKEVENFQSANPENINLVFSTIQGLHTRLNRPAENSLTYDDFSEQKLVLISDEAHHINAETKRGSDLSAEEKEDVLSWEGTVNRIFQANTENLLLEFTATADLAHPEINKKYSQKLLFDYPLKEFRKDGYSKEVKVLQADLPPLERALQALVLSQYRRKLFGSYKKHVKPVVLFKSKTIKESQLFFGDFVQALKTLKSSDLARLKANASKHGSVQKQLFEEDGGRALYDAFSYFEQAGITLENLVAELRQDFSEDKLIIVNSKEESQHKQLAVNSLEDDNNNYRAVFAVDKLNEGWDVLNLFDIVRLYDTRDGKSGKPGKTTMSEAQLIGRGARYYPFQLAPEQVADKRKYDEDPTNELRIGEELYYHSAYNPRYVQELHTALEEIGIKEREVKERTVRLKDSFKETWLYKKGLLFLNEQRKYDHKEVEGITESIREQVYQITLNTGFIQTSHLFTAQEAVAAVTRKIKRFKLSDFGAPVLYKAMAKLPFYQFSNLLLYFPQLQASSEFVTSEKYLGSIQTEVVGTAEQVQQLSLADKLQVALQVLEHIARQLGASPVALNGTLSFRPRAIKTVFTDKTLSFAASEGEDKEFGKSMCNAYETSLHLDLGQCNWYAYNDCYGTSEEKHLILYIDQIYEQLREKYENVYLLRNERHFQLYRFEDGKTLEPDFVLVLDREEAGVKYVTQVFIEAKGAHLLKADAWKEAFLLSLEEEHQLEQHWQHTSYSLLGMPFYNQQERKKQFAAAFEMLLTTTPKGVTLISS